MMSMSVRTRVMQARDKTTDDLACMGIAIVSQDHHVIEVMNGRG